MISLRASSRSAGASDLPLPVQRADVQPQLDAWYAAGLFTELADLIDWNAGDSFPVPARIPRPAPRIGLLYWPAFGALRFASATYLIDYYTLGLLRTQLGTDNAVTVSFSDSDDPLEVAREFKMYLVASRPLVQTVVADPPATEPTEDDAYIITLVDRRFYWQYAEGTPADSSTWAALLSGFVTKLGGIAGTVDTTPAAYLTPTAKWDSATCAGKPTAWLFESAAAAVGARVVYAANGTVSVQRPSPAHILDVTDFHAVNLDRLVAGGLLSCYEEVRAVPGSVTAVFYDASGTCPPQPQTVNTPVASASGGSGSACQSGASGSSATASVVAWLDRPSTDLLADRSTLAVQYAQDWYDWQQPPLEATYQGFPALPVASGFVGHYELYHDGETGYTRVTRPPVNYPLLFGKGLDACGGTGGDTSFLAVLTDVFIPGLNDDSANCYDHTTDSGQFYTYSWHRVDDSAGPPKLTYADASSPTPINGTPCDLPAFHVRNELIPVMRASGLITDVTACPAGASLGYTFTLTGLTGTGAELNGLEWTLQYTSGGVWAASQTTASGTCTATLTVSAGPVGTLNITGGAITGTITYVLNPWVCTGGVTLSRTADPGYSAPATLGLAALITAALSIIDPLSVVRMWPGEGNYYLFDQGPWIDLFKTTTGTDANGTVANFRYFDQSDPATGDNHGGTWQNGREIRFITAE